ncbi:MAG TPA: CvpA family protein [Gammaproteobacteria bacterium]|nr:CvpA family protein [Gammaproteobacteria bacterium]
MTWADYAILVIILISALMGLVRGFLREVVSLLIWMLGFWVALRFAPTVGDAFEFVKSADDRLIIGYVVILVAVLIVGTVAGFLIKKLIEGSGSDTSDRSLGTLFGAARGVVVVTVLILLGSTLLVPQPAWWRKSKLIPYARPLVAMARRLEPMKVDFKPLKPADLNLNPS